MSVHLECLSHTPLLGHFDPPAPVLEEVLSLQRAARDRIAAFDPELVVLFSPDHFNGFFYNVMPSFCIGTGAHAIGDFDSLAGTLNVPFDLATDCAAAVVNDGIDAAISHDMQVDHGTAYPLQHLIGALDKYPVIPVFINSVAKPLPTFKRARLLGEAVGRWAASTGKRVLLIGSGGLSHQPPVPEYASAPEQVRKSLDGAGYTLSPEDRAARTNRTIAAGKAFVQDRNSLHPLNPAWDNGFLDMLETQTYEQLDRVSNDLVSQVAGRSTHEVKAWLAAFAALSAFGPYRSSHRYYREIPEWIAGFGALSAKSLGA
ncbi:3-carboxyethylcatechol 2,3-dioxygenase [Herbaspirillum sp. SJZ107]|uniref:3-carboxyethylcatechol 2,3-dioxygenase n=1 Tax=Herbaspirillum sp. SJZ107 TaxID=2572881 RepID=UPI001154AE99|nr:3-carboxyethylcatechol 2,3-dioxygenase [Herbaspirillum sp. SJZ107]TQK07850.1 2,3-dihydroxyphenylpropionate 1,2-dioxygenase [Herbaspirillum sp. SJZ107]